MSTGAEPPVDELPSPSSKYASLEIDFAFLYLSRFGAGEDAVPVGSLALAPPVAHRDVDVCRMAAAGVAGEAFDSG